MGISRILIEDIAIRSTIFCTRYIGSGNIIEGGKFCFSKITMKVK